MPSRRIFAGAFALATILLSAPVSARIVTLTPDADTYVEVGSESTYDHGKCSYFDVDMNPWGVSYLKFDLTGISESEQVISANLTLRCSNSSNDGGTIYPVSSAADWSEGDRCGPGGSGLKWGDVDCNGDGKITNADYSCPVGGNELLPLFYFPIATLGSVSSGKSYTRDVTAWFEGLRGGEGPVNLAIVNSSSDGASYRSREYSMISQRPVLELEVEDAPRPPQPPNDHCADAKVITSVNFSEIVDTRSAGYDDWDPDPTCVGTCCPSNVVWYAYTPASGGIVAVTTQGSNYDAGVAVYVGTCNGDEDTVLDEVACAADFCFNDAQPSRLSFAAVPGTTYLIMVWDGVDGEGGTLHFNLSQPGWCPGPL